MNKKSREALPVANLDFLKDFPHVLQELIHLVMGEWEPTAPQQERLARHLAECLYCQIALQCLIETVVDEESAHNLPAERERGRALLSQITVIIHETGVRDDIGAYIETLDAQGEGQAKEKFPLLAEHLKHCRACDKTVTETLHLLR